jgi:NADH-quinone oxidoreductase subunit C
MNDDTNENVSPAPEAPKKKTSAREMMALRKAAEEGDADAKAQLEALKSPAPAAPPVAPTPVAAATEGEPKKKMSAREMMALRKAAEEGDADAKAQLDALKSAPAAAPPVAPAPVASATEGEPKKKISAREMMALRKAAEEGDADAKAQLEALKSGEAPPSHSAPVPAPEPVAAPAPRPAPPAKPAAVPPPTMTTAQEAELARFKERFGDGILDSGLSVDVLRITVGANSIVEVARYCAEIGYNYPDTITAVDFLDEAKFRVVYILANVPDIKRTIVLHVDVPRDGQPVLPTISHIYPGADWDEREIYDLFGVVFEGHSDMRRIMTPDDWEGHPLRKDYTFID